MMSAKSKSGIKTEIISSGRNPRIKLLIGTPTLGIIRMEWHCATKGQIIPCNWSNGTIISPVVLGYLVDDAQNIIVQEFIDKNYEWLFLHEDDVILPPDAFIKINEYIRKADVPVVSGLYYTKSEPAEPILYRGRGNSFYDNWKRGQKVWVDGVPTGCLLIHGSIIKLMYKESEPYDIVYPNLVKKIRRVFQTPRQIWCDPESHQYQANIGTSDLYWCDKVIEQNVLKRAGWPKIARKKNPFLVDTTIFCRHIDLQTGKQYPQV